MLEGVQQTLLEMRTENQRMAAEITELKSSFKKNSMEISSLKTALKKEHNENEVLKKSLNSLKAKVDIQEREINELYTVSKMILNSIRVNTRSKYMVFQKICIHQPTMWLSSLASD